MRSGLHFYTLTLPLYVDGDKNMEMTAAHIARQYSETESRMVALWI